MTFELKDLFYVGGIIVTAVAGWVTLKNKVDNLEEKRIDHSKEDERQFNAIWAWKDGHDKDVEEKRFEFMQRINTLETRLSMAESSHTGLSRNFEKLEGKIDALVERIDKFMDRKGNQN